MRYTWLTLALAVIVTFSWLAGRDVRVAIVSADGETAANLAVLLEGQLSDRPGVAVVERTAVESILREQKLQALFSPDAVKGRVAIGKLLKADLLFMLRKAQEPEKGFELIACDTSQGLRLCVERIPASGDAAAMVAELQAIVGRALKKRGEKITQIIAVPPLLSNDLGLAAQFLQRPLAKIIEQSLLARSGVVVVETAEAKAIATEMSLTDSVGIDRMMPLYLMGEYRHDNFANGSPMKFQLRLLHGDKQVGLRASSSMKNTELAIALPQKAIELLDELRGPPGATGAMPAQAVDEAEQLARRAQTMYRVESWNEATDLAEASLLLKSDRVAMHRLAADALQLEARRLYEKVGNPAGQADVQTLYERGLSHLEAFMSAAPFSMKQDLVVLSPYLEHCSDHAALRAMMLRVLVAKQATVATDETIRSCTDWSKACWAEFSPEEVDRWTLETARVWPETADPDGIFLARFIAANIDITDRYKVHWMARSLADLEKPVAARAAEVLIRMSVDRTAQWKAKDDASPDANATILGSAAVMRHYQLSVQVRGAVSAGSALDFAWDNKTLYLWPAQKEALPQPLLTVLAKGSDTPVCYDGRYAWAFRSDAHEPGAATGTDISAGLAAYDPVSKHVTVLGVESGLPSDEVRAVSIAPIAPGKVCVVAHFGPSVGGRVWIAMATLNRRSPDKRSPDKRGPDQSSGTINVFHEARDFNCGAAADWKNSHLAFDVSRAHVLRHTSSDGVQHEAVLVERGALGHPLLIDPNTLKVSVIEYPVYGIYPSRIVEHEGTLFWMGESNGGYRICRLALPELKVEEGKEFFVSPGSLFFFKQHVGMMREGKLWLADDPLGRFHRVPLRIDGESKSLSTTYQIASDKHGLLFARFGALHELVLPR